jgi:4-hydroxybenzoate polyprenyltransferase
MSKPGPLTFLRPYLQLLRPPNVLTAVSDIWAGIALSGAIGAGSGVTLYWKAVILLSLAAACLYGGGVVINDFCDASLDRRERPERPIPSGRVSRTAAGILGLVLLAIGIILAAAHSAFSGILALLIALAAILYDAWAKHHVFFGPLNMGVCRGLDLLLGMSILPAGMLQDPWIAVIPVIYIAAITLISRGEVHGTGRSPLITALFFYLAVFAAVVCVGLMRQRAAATMLFLLLFAVMVLPPLVGALLNPAPRRSARAVKAGVLAVILLNAAWVAAGSGLMAALVTALLLPFSLWLAGRFSVT